MSVRWQPRRDQCHRGCRAGRVRRTLAPGMGTEPQKPLALIVARELASNLATPMFLLDADGHLVFYNDAAEVLLARPFSALGPIEATVWAELLDIRTVDGDPMDPREAPPGIALLRQRPSHAALQATSGDGTVHTLEVTAYPLFATPEELHGVVAIFWEHSEA